MMNKDIPVGSRVRLSEDTKWTIKNDNPTGVLCTVIDVDSWVEVDWDNDSWNSYKGCHDDLIVVEEEA